MKGFRNCSIQFDTQFLLTKYVLRSTILELASTGTVLYRYVRFFYQKQFCAAPRPKFFSIRL